MSTIVVKVVNKTTEAEDIVSLELASIDDNPLPLFSAGSHIDVHVPGGLIRQYSLCNNPVERHRYQIAVLREPQSRGGSIGMHHIKVGDVVRISEPRNLFPLTPADHYLLIAGGIGVTPILCMAERLSTVGASFSMHYCSRSPERAAFLSRISTSQFSARSHVYFDNTDVREKLDLGKIIDAAPPGTHIYVCGPSGFIDFVTDTTRIRGWPTDRVHLEYFGNVPQDTDGDTAFEVKIASSGERYPIPADKSVWSTLLEHGIDIPVSCEQGICGTCITRVLQGTPDHRDVYLTDEEKAKNDQFAPCCSRARTALLVLDL